jgi:hypothetical protein
MKTNVLISIDTRHLGRMPAVVEELERAGVEVHRSLQSLGTVSGAIEPQKIAAVEGIDGVESVDAERSLRIPPPDSPVQ